MNAPISESIICEMDAPVVFFVLEKDSGEVYALIQLKPS